LPNCNHVLQNAKCWQDQEKSTLKCETQVKRQLTSCEHSKVSYVSKLILLICYMLYLYTVFLIFYFVIFLSSAMNPLRIFDVKKYVEKLWNVITSV